MGDAVGSFARELLVCAAGLATTLVTAIVLALIAGATDFDFLALSYCFVIPLGAMLSGFGAASGYYAGGRIFQQRPGLLVALVMLPGAVGLQVLVIAIRYVDVLGDTDEPLLTHIWRFPTFVELYVTSGTIRIRNVESGEVGRFGWALAVLQTVGLLIGHAAAFFALLGASYCERCRRYLSKVGEIVGYTGDIDGQRAFVAATCGETVCSPSYRARIDALPNVPLGAIGQTRVLLTLRRCNRCGLQRVQENVESMRQGQWEVVDTPREQSFEAAEGLLSWWSEATRARNR